MREKPIEKAIIHYVRHLGGYVVKVQSGKVLQSYKGKYRAIHMAPAGTPDLIGSIGGRFVAIEVKNSEKEKEKWEAYPLGLRGKPVKFDKRTQSQKHTRDIIERSGGIFILACGTECVSRALMDKGVIDSSMKTVRV